jgi:putative salt-induced outer membrane protein YdiY
MTRNVLLLCLFLAVAAPVAVADTIALTNGDRLTGTVVALSEEGLALETAFLGEVTAAWDAVDGLTSDAPLYVSFTGDQVVRGTLVITDGEALVATADAGQVRIDRDMILAIRSEARYLEYQAELERQLDPGMADLWIASVDGALSLTDGNAETRSVNLGMRAARTTSRDRTSLYLTSLFASNSTTGTPLTTANAVRGGTRYELELSDNVFTFGFADLESDRFQELDLRLVLGGGMGLHLVDTDRTELQVFGGGSSNQEYFESGVRRKTGEAVVGQEWTYRLNRLTSFTERLALYPNLSEIGEYRMTFDSTATTRLNEWLNWQVTVSDRYLSNPRPGKAGNDLLFTTGIRITLGEGAVGAVGPGNINFR